MKKNFLEYRSFIESNFPQLSGHIDGMNYPPPEYAVHLASLTSYCYFGGILFLVLGETIFNSLQIPLPSLYLQYVRDNKMMAFFGLMILQSVGNSFLTTGAFEIYVDGDLVFSKLESKRFPSGPELIDIFNQRSIKGLKGDSM